MEHSNSERVYTGGALCRDLPNGRCSGTLRIYPSRLSFKSESETVDFSFSGLRVQSGGASNRLIFFSHPSRPAWSVYTSDRSILKDPLLRDAPEVSEGLARIGNRNLLNRLGYAALFLMALGALYGLWSLKDSLVTAAAARIPVAWEEELGDIAFKQLGLQHEFLKDEELLRQLRGVTDPLLREAASSTERSYNFQFHISNDPTVNAFALPGGHLVVNTGLLLKAKAPEEVAGVLAHELAHVTRQHSVRQLVNSVGLYLLIQTLLGDMEGLLAILADNGGYLLTMKFSRDFEREADEQGWSYLTAANVNPRGMVDFFTQLRELEEARAAEAEEGALAGMEEALSFLGTHPATAERIARLEAKWEGMREKRGFEDLDFDLRGFQRLLRARLGE